MQRIQLQYVGVYPGARNPVVFEDLHSRDNAALEQFLALFRAVLEDEECIAAKLCLNTDTTRPWKWKGAIAYCRYMIVNNKQYKNDTTSRPGSTSPADGRFELHYDRLCGEYLEKAVTRCNSDILCTDLLLLMEQVARNNEFVTAFVLVVLDHQNNDPVTHISFSEIDLYFSQYPLARVGGMSVNELKEHHRRLFPEAAQKE